MTRVYIDLLQQSVSLCSSSGECFQWSDSTLRDLQTQDEIRTVSPLITPKVHFLFPGFYAYKPDSTWGQTSDVQLLTACKENEYTCADLSCVYIWQKCDGLKDCPDGTDEGFCSQPRLGNSNDVSLTSPPSLRTKLTLYFKRFHIAKVNDGNGIITVSLTLHTRWLDGRIQFKMLRENWILNELNEDFYWNPEYELMGATFVHSIAYSNGNISTTKLFAVNNGIFRNVLASDREGLEYSGEMLLQEELEADFLCEFNVFLYPFGLHICEFKIRILNFGPETPIFNMIKQNLSDSLESTQARTRKFEIIDMHVHYPGNRSCALKVLLGSVYTGTMFSTGVPCFIITYIGDLTLWFNLDNFTDRIMVTLSCLIVLASLFSQTNATSPASNSPKVLDIFFLASIVTLFVICAHHCILHYLIRRNENPTSKSKKHGCLFQKFFACFERTNNSVGVKSSVINVREKPCVMDSFSTFLQSENVDVTLKNIDENYGVVKKRKGAVNRCKTSVSDIQVQPHENPSRKPFYKIYNQMFICSVFTGEMLFSVALSLHIYNERKNILKEFESY